MNLMISKAAFRIAPVPTHDDAAVDVISNASAECALGLVLIARSAAGVCAILIGANRDETEVDQAVRFSKAQLVANEVVDDDLAKVIRFVDNSSEGLHLSLDMRGTTFQRRIGEKLWAIPGGRTVTRVELDQPPRVAPCGAWGVRRQSNRTGPSLAIAWCMAIWPPPMGHRAQA